MRIVEALGPKAVAILFVMSMAGATLSAAAVASAAAPVTGAADSLRTGWYPDEPQLTPQLLESGGFGRNFATPVQGQVYAQPLVSGNTLFAATEDNWIYGVDPRSGAVRWQRQVGTPWNAADLGCADLAPHVGVTATPVIDPATNIAYFTAKGYAAGNSGPAVWLMHAVDLADGAEEPGFPVQISGQAQNLPGVTFDPTQQLQRPALLLMNGVVYAAFGSHCDDYPFEGWIAGVSTTGTLETLWATSQSAASIWQAGGGLVSDGEGQILFASGNGFSPLQGPGDQPPEGHLGDSVARLRVEPGGTLAASDFFSPFNNVELDEADLDLGSGAPLGLPSPYFGTAAIPDLLVEVGKQGVIYLLNRDDLGGMGQGPEGKNADVQEISGTRPVLGSLATWPGDGGYVYIPSIGALEVLRYGLDGAGAPHISLAATSPENLAFGSGSPLVTSNSTTPGSGIVWISQCTSSPACEGSTLNAYAAVPVAGAPRLLWKGDIGISTKFARPDASGGRIYVGTRDGQVLAFGATHHTLTVAREESAGGLVRSDVSGIDCGSSCSHSFADGTRVTLTATPSNHFEFTGWSGGACSGTGPCQLSMYSDVSVTASFARITHSVTVAKSGTGAGAVTSSPAGIACGTICSARFEAGGDVTLEANLSNSAVSWSGCTSVAANICRITDLEADRQVTASFVGLPETSLTRAKVDRSRGYATFRFRGAGADGGFQCRLVRPRVKHHKRTPSGFSKCRSPKAFRHLSHGHYVFEVRAINAAGPDPTPAKRRFRI